MNNKNLKRFLFASVLLPITLMGSSCSFSSAFIRVEPFNYKVLAQKGSASLALSTYYTDENLHFTDDIAQLEEAFKGQSDQEDDFQMIFYDSVRGLDLCQEYGNYVYAATIARGNQQLVPLKKDIDQSKTLKVLCNNEFGSLGKTAKKILTAEEGYDLSFSSLNELDYYNYFFNGEYKETDYDYAFISEPYATRLMTVKESSLYNKEYDEYTINEDRGDDPSKKMYCESLKNFYIGSVGDSDISRLGIPQTGIFVNRDFYQKNQGTMDKVFYLFNKVIGNRFVTDARYTRLDFFNLSEDYNDVEGDPNSEQTLLAYKYQFDTVGISWSEVTRLQAWHIYLGQDAPFEKYINRLEYPKNITSYYKMDAIKSYYQFLGEPMPDPSYFIELKL